MNLSAKSLQFHKLVKRNLLILVNGGWSEWSSSQCTDGMSVKSRVCNNPEPTSDGVGCEGLSMVDEVCAGLVQRKGKRPSDRLQSNTTSHAPNEVAKIAKYEPNHS